MNLVETRNMADIFQIIPQEAEIRKDRRDQKSIRDMLSYLKRQFESNPNFHVVMTYGDGDSIVSYAFFEICASPDEKNIMIHRLWYDKEHIGGLLKLYKLFKEVGKTFKLNTVRALAPNKEMKDILWEWGFRPAGVLMENTKAFKFQPKSRR